MLGDIQRERGGGLFNTWGKGFGSFQGVGSRVMLDGSFLKQGDPQSRPDILYSLL